MGPKSLQYTCLVLYALTLCCIAQYQYGEMVCIKDFDTDIMTATMYIYKNGSAVTRAYFFDNATKIENTDSDCDWTGTGSDTDPWVASVQIVTTTDNPPAGRDGCNRHVVISGDTYEWYAHSQAQVDWYRKEDLFFQFQCNHLVNSVSLTMETILPGVIDLETRPGTITLGAVNNLNDLDTVTTIAIGEEFHLQLRYQPSSLTNDLKPWGAYCQKLYATPDSNYIDRRQYLLNTDGCPRTDSIFLQPSDPFTAIKPVNSEDIYFAYTGAIVAARFDKVKTSTIGSYPTVYLVCEAELCFMDNDLNCIDQCAASSARRRRSDEEPMQIVTVLNIVDKTTTAEQSDTDYIPIVTGVAGGLVLLALILGIVFCLCRRTRESRDKSYMRHSDSSSYTSSVTSSSTGRKTSHRGYPHSAPSIVYKY